MSILPSLNEPASQGNVIKLILLIGGLGLLGWYLMGYMKTKPAKRKKNPVKGIPVIDNSEDEEEEVVEEEVEDEDEDEDVEELSQYY